MTFQKLSRIVEAVYSVCSCSDCVVCWNVMYSDTVTHIEMTDEMLFTEMYKLQSIQYKIIIILITIYLYIYII